MLSTEERNNVFIENYALISSICKRAACRVKRVFPNVCSADLVEYAYLGALEALSKADFSHPGVKKFIWRYGYVTAMDGVSLMLGMKRNRSKKLDTGFMLQLFIMAPEDLKLLIETAQETDWCVDLSYVEIDKKIDLEWLYTQLKGSYEYLVLKSLMDGLRMDDITVKYGLKPRRIRKYVDRLYNIYLCIAKNREFGRFITPIKEN